MKDELTTRAEVFAATYGRRGAENIEAFADELEERHRGTDEPARSMLRLDVEAERCRRFAAAIRVAVERQKQEGQTSRRVGGFDP